MSEKHCIVIDQSTSASKVFLLDEKGGICRRYAKSHRQYYPQPGFVEHDAEEIWQNVRAGIVEMAATGETVAGLAITNQRETTVLWERATGKPVYKAVVWQDVRGEGICRELREHGAKVRERTGLTLSPYFPAAKAASVLREREDLLRRACSGEICIGTVDSYLVYRLTGGRVFRTDVSNASRTQLWSLDALSWDEELCGFFGIPVHCLPQVVHSDAGFGKVSGIPPLEGIPIVSVMGDSHAALFGQGCYREGMAKATYGTGSSVMLNIGPQWTLSQNGLSTSVGYAFQGNVCYVLEGNVTCSGDTLCWLRDEAGLVTGIGEVETLAGTVPDTRGVYFVPAFSGLGAVYSAGDARALLCGMNRGTTRAEIVRAALESMAFQDADVLLAMERDTGKGVQELRVDGAPTKNGLLMQFQADILNCPVQCAHASEISALGVGYMAGVTLGMYKDIEGLSKRQGHRYVPQQPDSWREGKLRGWKEAVERCR